MFTCSQLEPPWAEQVTATGDVFYIEPDTGQHSHHHHTNLINGSNLSNGDTHSDQDEEETPKTKKGLRMKMKDLVSSGTANNPATSTSVKKHSLKIVSLNATNLSAANGSHGVTFNDIPTGVTKEAVIFVDPKRHNYGRRATLCETLFGIIPGFFGTRNQVMNTPLQDKRIMVQGLLPGGEAMRCGIKIGEWLMAVNEAEVDFDNIDTLLAGVTTPQQVGDLFCQ